MSCLERVENYLKEHGVAYRLHHHPSGAFTAQEVAALEHISGRLVAKVVMAFSDGAPAMFALPAPDRLDVEKAASALGSGQVRLATEDEFAPYFPDCELGAMPPFGNLYGLPVYLDRSLTEDPTIYFQGGTHSDMFEMETSDFLRLAGPAIVDVTGSS